MTDIHEARGAMRAAVRAIRETRDAQYEPVQSQVREAVQALAARKAVAASPKAFRDELYQLGVSKTQATKLAKILAVREDMLKAVLTALATVPAKQASTDRLDEALTGYIASTWCQLRVAPKPFRRSHPRLLDGETEFGPLVTWLGLDHMAPDVRLHALCLMLVYVRSGHAARDGALELARAGQLDEAAHNVELRLRDTLLRLRVSDTDSGPPAAHRASSSDCGLWDEDDDIRINPSLVDAAIRGAEDPHAIHIAICNLSPGDLMRWPATVATAVRNGINLVLEPFEQGDHIGSLSFISRSWLGTKQRPTDELPVLESLTMNAMLGAGVNPLEVDPLDALRFDHLVIGGSSSAVGGLALDPKELVERAAAQWVEVVRIVSTWPLTDVPRELLDDAGAGLMIRYQAWARPIMLAAKDHLLALAEKSAEEFNPVGERVIRHLIRELVDGLPDGPKHHVRRPEQGQALAICDRMQRDRTFEALQESMSWDPQTEARMAHARDHASTPIWEEMLRAHRSRNKG